MPINYKEIAFEDAIEQYLLQFGGYKKRNAMDYNKELAIDTEVLFGFIKDSQPKQWAKLCQNHGSGVEQKFLQRLVKELDNRGMLDVLRHGVIDLGVKVQLAFFKPVSGMNYDARELYHKNTLTVTRQVKYSLKNENSIDMLLSINGLPVMTLELKNPLTGQTVTNAKLQYMHDRDPKELLFQFKKRALVHFAVDPDEVYMTTCLSGGSTYFLPFNKGNNGGAGNTINPAGHRTSYLWEEVLLKDSLMDLIARFLHLQVEEKIIDGKKIVKEAMIFPRYHQLDVVRKLEEDVRNCGAGKNYLIQHSAGSGKSNSIAWIAHRLASLHDSQDNAIFTSVVVVTDRRILDKQLQDTIYQFEHKEGVVQKIDKHSDQLKEALENGTKIIITTLQKFPIILGKVKDISGNNFAVIVDEAHSSQSGEASQKLKQILADASLSLEQHAELEAEEEVGREDYEDEIVREMKAQGQHKNLSFFAFTATPKQKTMELFGWRDEKGIPYPFHVYSMRQAIEEEFILDVLKNYLTYATYFKLAKAIEDDPNFDKKKANRALTKFLTLHPYNLSQKTEVMVEHFRDITRTKIGGRAKAMLVTSSRLQAVRYYHEFKKYIHEKDYRDLGVLVAFSGVVRDDEKEYTEPGLNKISETELRKRFNTDEFHILIVAEKYQTGFDQPLLHTMFVDKKLSGIKAVQTLSRLNRTCPGKTDTFILDFVNEAEEILKSFQPYYEQTAVTEVTDPNLVYDIKTKLDKFQIYWQSEIENFAKVFFKSASKQGQADHGALNAYLNPAADRYKQKPVEEQEEFKSSLVSFIRLYSFVTQIIRLQDADLHKFHDYAKFLLRKLPHDTNSGPLYLDSDVALEYYRLEKIAEQELKLQIGDTVPLPPTKYAGTGGIPDKSLMPLSKIIHDLNERFGTNFSEMDKILSQMAEDFAANEDLRKKAQNNSMDNFKYPFESAFINIILDRMSQNEAFFNKVLDDEKFQNELKEMMLPVIYERLRMQETTNQI
jgi:type I restriction enzyme R subunit